MPAPRPARSALVVEGLVAGLLLWLTDWVAAGVLRTPASIVGLSALGFASGGLLAGLVGAAVRRRGVALAAALGGALALHGLSIVSKGLPADASSTLRTMLSAACVLIAGHYGALAGWVHSSERAGAAWSWALVSATGVPAASLAYWAFPDVTMTVTTASALLLPIAAWLLARTGARVGALVALALLVALGLPTALLDREPPRRFVPEPNQARAAAGAPNVVLILIDTLRADHLDPKSDTTPNLAALARGGAEFTQAVSSASWTLPATASLLTSLYPSQHGAVMATTSLSGEVETLAEVFHAAGYETVAFTGGAFVSPAFGLDQGFEYFDHLAEFRFRPFRIHVPLAWRVAKNRYLAWRPLLGHVNEFGGMRAVNERVEQWLGERSPERPFFLLVHSYQVHDYYIYHHEPDAAVHETLGPPSPAFAGRLSVHPSELVGASQADLDWFHAIYESRIRFVDAELGHLMDSLLAHVGSAPTVVALTSDHGEGFDAARRRVHHGDRLHDDLLLVPLLLSAPGRVEPGTRVERQVRTIDLMPTLIELAGLELPEGLAGRSLFASGRSETGWPDLAFGEEIQPERRQLALRTAEWKLIRKTGAAEPEESYDLAADPLESAPPAGPPPEALLEYLQRFRERYPERDLEQSAIDPATLGHLRALGYVE